MDRKLKKGIAIMKRVNFKLITVIFLLIASVAYAATNKTIKAVGSAAIDFVTGGSTRLSISSTGALSGTSFLDEDNMASDSATSLASQQSIKAYVDANGISYPLLDGVFQLGNTADNTKLVDFDLSGITTSTTRTLTVDDEDITLRGQNSSTQMVLALKSDTQDPELTVAGDTDTGIRWDAAGSLVLKSNSTNNMVMFGGTNSMYAYLRVFLDGSASSPSIHIGGSGTNTGFYNADTSTRSNVNVATEGVEAFEFDGVNSTNESRFPLIVDNYLSLKEISSCGTATASYHRLCVDSDDNELHISDSSGVDRQITGHIPSVAMGALDVDWSAGNVFTKSISANSTITFSNQSSGQAISLIINADSTERTLTWTPTLKWAGGNAQVTVAASASLVCSFIYDGTNTWASCIEDMQ